MANTVDHAGSEHRDPHHLHGPDGDAVDAEQGQVDHGHDGNAAHGEAGVDVALQPVVRTARAVFVQGFLIFCFFTVQFRAFAQHLLDAFDLWAVRVIFGFALGVVLAMDGGPFPGVLAGAQPQPETEEVLQDRAQFQCPVSGVAVQVDRHADDGGVGHGQGNQHQCAQTRGQQAVFNKI